MKEEKKLIIENGKYTFYIDENNRFKCDRYNDKRWRDFTGDKAVYCLFYEALKNKQKLNKIVNLIDKNVNNTFNSNTTGKLFRFEIKRKLLEAIQILQNIFNIIREAE